MLNTHVIPWIIVSSLLGFMVQKEESPEVARKGIGHSGASRENVPSKKAAVPGGAVSEGRSDAGQHEISQAKTFAPSSDETNISVLLRSRAVQSEIHLTGTQAKEIDALLSTQPERSRPLMLNRMDSTGDPVKWAEANAVCLQFTQQSSIEIKACLKPNQAQRLTQIAIQHAGLHALLMPEVAEVLGLAPELQEEIRALLDESTAKAGRWSIRNKEAELREYGKFDGKSWEEFRKSASYLTTQAQQHRDEKAQGDEVHRQVYRLLTRRQRQKFESLGGQPFDPERHRPKVDNK